MDKLHDRAYRHLVLRDVRTAGGVRSIPENRCVNTILDHEPLEPLTEPCVHELARVAINQLLHDAGRPVDFDGEDSSTKGDDETRGEVRGKAMVERGPLPVRRCEPYMLRFGLESQGDVLEERTTAVKIFPEDAIHRVLRVASGDRGGIATEDTSQGGVPSVSVFWVGHGYSFAVNPIRAS